MNFINKTFGIFLEFFSINETKLNILISQIISLLFFYGIRQK